MFSYVDYPEIEPEEFGRALAVWQEYLRCIESLNGDGEADVEKVT